VSLYLYFDEEFLNVNDLVSDERLEKHTEETNQPVLHVLVPDGLASGDAVRDVLKTIKII
jgi:hypothetical protein